jgi:hypothetical protein
MGQKRIVAIGPQMRVERVRALLGAGLHRHAPSARERLLELRRQHFLKRRVLQMIEQDFGHRVPEPIGDSYDLLPTP